MAAQSAVLIIGAGPRIGASVAEGFANNGYQVAIASRKGTGGKDDKGYLSLKVDLANPDSVPALFEAVKSEFQVAPSVVIYNAATLTMPPVQDSLFSIPASAVIGDLNVNTISPYVAAQQAVLGWETLPKDVKKTFIYTGNILNLKIFPVPMMLNLGIGKSASAYWIGTADALYSAQGFRFFYADQRDAEGKNVDQSTLSGPAHSEFFLQLAKHDGDIPWAATFTKGKGYQKY